MSSSTSLLGLRLLQLVRPILIIVVLRWFDVGTASLYVAMLGVYVIALEVYNVVAPSDRLYLPESAVADLVAVMRRRLQYAVLVLPLSAWAMMRWVDLPWVSAVILALVSGLNGFSTAVVAYLYGRVPVRALRVAEGLSWVVQGAAVLLLLSGGSLLWGFVVCALEQALRAGLLVAQAERGTLDRGGERADAGLPSGSVARMAVEGLTLTLANHIHRIPFVVAVGQVDPLFVLAAQVSGAVYNVLIGLSSRFHVPARHGLYLLACLGLVVAFFLAHHHLPDARVRLLVQTGLLCGLGVIHGAVMTHLPGRFGLMADRRSRWLLIAGLLGIVGVGSTVSATAFLGSPMVLILAGLVFSGTRQAHAKL